nr:prepilin-type N-terminal cleavage/methylation domain-containing protein [Citrobacter amalonaticus]
MLLAWRAGVCQSDVHSLKERTMDKQRGFTLIELMVIINSKLL